MRITNRLPTVSVVETSGLARPPLEAVETPCARTVVACTILADVPPSAAAVPKYSSPCISGSNADDDRATTNGSRCLQNVEKFVDQEHVVGASYEQGGDANHDQHGFRRQPGELLAHVQPANARRQTQSQYRQKSPQPRGGTQANASHDGRDYGQIGHTSHGRYDTPAMGWSDYPPPVSALAPGTGLVLPGVFSRNSMIANTGHCEFPG